MMDVAVEYFKTRKYFKKTVSSSSSSPKELIRASEMIILVKCSIDFTFRLVPVLLMRPAT